MFIKFENIFLKSKKLKINNLRSLDISILKKTVRY